MLRWCDTNGMLVFAHKCAVLTHGLHEANYHINGTVIPVEDTVRDRGIHMSGNLDFTVHIHTITQSARRLINTLFRCFVIKNTEVYIRMYNIMLLLYLRNSMALLVGVRTELNTNDCLLVYKTTSDDISLLIIQIYITRDLTLFNNSMTVTIEP